jgi:hypothetical protein
MFGMRRHRIHATASRKAEPTNGKNHALTILSLDKNEHIVLTVVGLGREM